MAAMSVLTVKLVTVALEQDLVGIYNSSYGYLQLFGILADFGLYAVAIRELSRAKDRPRVLTALLLIRMCTVVFSMLLALALVWSVPGWRGPFAIATSIAALVPLFTLLAGIPRTVLQVEHKMQFVFAAEILQRIFTTLTIAAFVVWGVRDSANVWLCYLFIALGGVGAVILLIVSIASANRFLRLQWPADRDLVKEIALSALPFGCAYVCIALYRQFDTTMIALLQSDYTRENALYGVVIRMTEMGFIIPTYLLNSTLPSLSSKDTHPERSQALLQKTFVLLLIIGLSMMLAFYFWARPLVQLLTTEAYLSTPLMPGSDTALAILALPVFLNVLVLYAFYVLLTKHRWRELLWPLAAASVLSLGSNVLLISAFDGFLGAAWNSVFIHVMLTALLLPRVLAAAPLRLEKSVWLQLAWYALLVGGALAVSAPWLDTEWKTLVASPFIGLATLAALYCSGLWKLVR